MENASAKKMKSAVESAISIINRSKVQYAKFDGSLAEMSAPTMIRDFEPLQNGSCRVQLFTYELKAAGQDDEDGNDAVMEDSLKENFIKAIGNVNADIEVMSWVGSEKGYWPVYLRFKSEIPQYAKRDGDISMKNAKIRTAKANLTELNAAVFTRISTQTAKQKSCPTCKSTVTVSYIKTHLCPVCATPLYTATDKKRADILQNKITTWEAELADL